MEVAIVLKLQIKAMPMSKMKILCLVLDHSFINITPITSKQPAINRYLKLSMIDIPMGTAYAIWTGIGTAGGTIIGMIFYHESKNIMDSHDIF
jgi:hypothetical protein